MAVAVNVFWALFHGVVYSFLVRTYGIGGNSPWCTKGSFHIDCHHPDNQHRVRTNRTHIKVIVQGAGQTGTTSVIAALRELGLNAWHADDYSVFAKRIMYDKFALDDWVATATRCGMEAISLEPVMDLFPVVLQTSPDAKVVLNRRPYESWVRSLASTAIKDRSFGNFSTHLYRAGYFIPWVELWDLLTGHIAQVRLRALPFHGEGVSIASLLYRVVCTGYGWPNNDVMNRGTRKIKAMEESYLALLDEAVRLTPKGNLLDFNLQRHGWPEFAAFLGVPAPAPGTSFPHPRSKNKRTNEEVFENNMDKGAIVWFLFCVMHAANYLIVWLVLQAFVNLLWAMISSIIWVLMGPPVDSEDAGRRYLEGLAACPVVAVLESLGPSEAVEVGKTLYDAGIRIIEVPLKSDRATDCITALVKSLPGSVVVGAGSALTAQEVDAVVEAGAVVVSSPHIGRSVIRRANGLGALSLPGVCTPNETAQAIGQGADGLVVFPAEQAPPEAVAHFKPLLPPTAPLLVAWVGAPRAASAYRAAGVSGFYLSAGLLRPQEGVEAVKQKLGEVLEKS